MRKAWLADEQELLLLKYHTQLENTYVTLLSQTDVDGRTPLHYAAASTGGGVAADTLQLGGGQTAPWERTVDTGEVAAALRARRAVDPMGYAFGPTVTLGLTCGPSLEETIMGTVTGTMRGAAGGATGYTAVGGQGRGGALKEGSGDKEIAKSVLKVRSV